MGKSKPSNFSSKLIEILASVWKNNYRTISCIKIKKNITHFGPEWHRDLLLIKRIMIGLWFIVNFK